MLTFSGEGHIGVTAETRRKNISWIVYSPSYSGQYQL